MVMLVVEEPPGTKHLYNRIDRATHRGTLDSSRDLFFLTVKG
jgi:hypothetical protein